MIIIETAKLHIFCQNLRELYVKQVLHFLTRIPCRILQQKMFMGRFQNAVLSLPHIIELLQIFINMYDMHHANENYFVSYGA
jgi:hypothetical protein